jgi:hypothetical protein
MSDADLARESELQMDCKGTFRMSIESNPEQLNLPKIGRLTPLLANNYKSRNAEVTQAGHTEVLNTDR